MVVGAVLLFTSYVLWSPGTFGLCEEPVRLVEHNIFGTVERCEIGFNIDSSIKIILEYIGLVFVVASSFSFFLNFSQFKVFISSFFIGLMLVLSFIFFFPDFDVMYGATYDVKDRSASGALVLAIYTVIVYLHALIRAKTRDLK